MHSPMVEAMLNNPQQVCTEVTSSELMCFGIGIIGWFCNLQIVYLNFTRCAPLQSYFTKIPGKPIRDYDLGSLKKLGEKEKKELELNENFSSRSSSVAGLESSGDRMWCHAWEGDVTRENMTSRVIRYASWFACVTKLLSHMLVI